MKEPDKNMIRPCLVSGLFYPDEKAELTARLEESMKGHPGGESGLILTPHGSYSTTGDCMAAAFSAARDRPVETVVLLGSVHREKDSIKLCLPEKTFFETPLGYAPVNELFADELTRKSFLFTRDDKPHLEEHCLEVQLPYIRHLFPGAEILPILVGKMNRKQIRKAAAELDKLYTGREKSLLTVLSVNLSDFLPLTEGKTTAENLVEMIRFPLQDSLMEEEKNDRISTCGSVVLTLASELFPYAGPVQILRMQHTIVQDRGVEKGVFYGGGRWD